MNQQEWDERYAQQDRIWSGNPNVALVSEVRGLKPGTALDLGCGEGADAIWLATQGWTVTAADISPVALDRGRAHAAGLPIDFQHHDLAATFPAGSYDLVSAQFLHFYDNDARAAILRRAAAAVAPGGVLLIESHLDHGAFAHSHGDMHFPDAAETIAGLQLDPPWEVLTANAHPREQLGPDGTPTTRTDSTVKLRRPL